MLWIAIGTIDLLYFIYTVATGAGQSIDWNVVAIAVGIFLLNGNLKVARWMGTAAAFLLVGVVGYFGSTLLLRPPALWQVHLRLYPVYVVYFVGINLCLIAALSWTYKQLRRPATLQAYRAAGMNSKFPKIAFRLFMGVVISLVFLTHSILYGADAAEAKRLAQRQLGDQYAYHVSGMQWSGDLVSARVTAYSADEIRYTTVSWDKRKVERL